MPDNQKPLSMSERAGSYWQYQGHLESYRAACRVVDRDRKDALVEHAILDNVLAELARLAGRTDSNPVSQTTQPKPPAGRLRIE